MSDENKGGVAVIIGIVLVIALIGSLFKKDTPSSGGSGSYTPTIESTENKLRRVYDAQGIKYDDKMIREDARAVEELHREFGK
jgi:hypothetical protein